MLRKFICLGLGKRNIFGSDNDASPIGHGIAGIDAEIEDDLVDLSGIAQNRPEVLNFGVEIDGLGKGFLHDLLHLTDKIADLQDGAFAHVSPREGEHLLDHVGPAPGARSHGREQLLAMLVLDLHFH